jgi:hypothetical protein
MPIIERKQQRWQGPFPANPLPISQLQQAFTEQQFKCLQQLEQGQTTWTVVYKKYRSLLKLKHSLDEQPWLKPSTRQADTMCWFVHDLLFYLMLVHLCRQATFLFDGFFEKAQLPSQSALYHRVKHSSQWLLNCFSRHVPECHWIDKVLNSAEPPCAAQLRKLQLLIRQTHLPAPLRSLLQEALKHFEAQPEGAAYEYFLLCEMKTLCSHLTRLGQRQQWATVREIIHLCLATTDNTGFVISDYIQLLQACQAEIDMEGEYHYWKQAKKHYREAHTIETLHALPSYRLYQEIIRHCKQQKEQKMPETCRHLCHFNLDWTGHPLTLLRYLHPIISKGQLLINGSNDLSVFARFLSALGRIRKVRTKGHLTESSILTYLKKLNCGDIDLEQAH